MKDYFDIYDDEIEDDYSDLEECEEDESEFLADYDDEIQEDYYDYRRETFYALTDGAYGDYEDWVENGGTIDSLETMLGYD